MIFLNKAKRLFRGRTFFESVHRWYAILSKEQSALNKTEIEKILDDLNEDEIDFQPLPADFLVDFFLSVRRLTDKSTNQVYKQLSERASNLSADLLSARSWTALYHFLCLRGLFEAAFHVREKAVIATIEAGGSSHRAKNIKYISALIDSGFAKSTVLDAIDCLSATQFEKNRFRLFATFDVNTLVETRSSLLDESFQQHLADRSIAIVGPAEPRSPNASAIDSHETVTRLNFFHGDKGCDETFNGTRTSITYFNTEMARAFEREYDSKLPNAIKYACTKDVKSKQMIAARNKNVPVRKLLDFEGLSFCGALNMGPIAILDLAVHSNRTLEVYNMDLMTTIRRFSGYYPTALEQKNDASRIAKFKKSTVRHDPMTQFKLLHRLWKSDRITGDSTFLRVIQEGEYQYMKLLQDIYL